MIGRKITFGRKYRYFTGIVFDKIKKLNTDCRLVETKYLVKLIKDDLDFDESPNVKIVDPADITNIE